MLNWLSISGIKKETKRIRWAKNKELFISFKEVMIFIVLFGIFFVLCEFIITFCLKYIGIS